MNTVKFIVEITKNPNKQVDAFDAKIETILTETEIETPFKTVNLFNNKSFEQVFYNLSVNDKFIKQNGWWFYVSSDKKSNTVENGFDTLTEVEQELVSFKLPLDFDIIKLQKFVEKKDKQYCELTIFEKEDIVEQLELMQKLQSVLQRRHNRIGAKAYDSLNNEIPNVIPEDITDYECQLDFNGITSYSRKDGITSPVVNDDGSKDIMNNNE